jgi:hypothetical protein
MGAPLPEKRRAATMGAPLPEKWNPENEPTRVGAGAVTLVEGRLPCLHQAEER